MRGRIIIMKGAFRHWAGRERKILRIKGYATNDIRHVVRRLGRPFANQQCVCKRSFGVAAGRRARFPLPAQGQGSSRRSRSVSRLRELLSLYRGHFYRIKGINRGPNYRA
jgi:hypothetical protein